MALNAAATLQPWEEQQLPSPTDEKKSLPSLDLSRTRSTSLSTHSGDTSLHRVVSGDPDCPPPAWKRRPSQRSSSTGSASTTSSLPTRSQSLSASSTHQPQRRLPNGLRMTHANGLAPSTSRGGFPRQGPPPAAFRGRARLGNGSNRSSLASYDGMNSEELWTLEDDPIPDMSNPTRSSAERPLDTVRRMSYMLTDQSLYAGMPTEIIWPTAPAEEEYLYEPPPKTRSLTNVASIKRRTTLRKSKSKGAAMDSHPPISGGGYPKRAASKDGLSSAHSSTTSLSIPHNKSQASLKSSRPPSMAGVGAYHYDLLGALAPRDGGYAIAAQIGHSFSPVSSVNSLDDRRSIHASPPGSFRGARVPSSRSSGMRWSVDGEDPILPPGPVRGSGGSMLSVSSTQSDDYDYPQSAQLAVAQATRPCEPSPLSMQTTTAADMDAVASPIAMEEPQMYDPVPAPAPINLNAPVEAPEVAGSNLKKAKTKKEMKAEKKEAEKQAKLAAKAEAQRAAQQKAEAAKQAAEDKRRAQEEVVRAKAQAKADAARKVQEDKERAKLQKKEAERMKVEQAKAAEQRKMAEQKKAAELKNEQKLKKVAAPEPKVAAAAVKTEQTPKRRASLKFKRSSSGPAPDAAATAPIATPAARGSPPPAPSQASRLAPPVAAGAAAAAASQISNPSKSELYTGPRPPSNRTPSLSSTQASSTPRPEKEKRGFMTSLKKRFSMANMEPTPTPQKPRPNSIAVSQGSPTPSAPIASAAPQRAAPPAPAPAPAPVAQSAPVVQPPPRSTSASQQAPVQQRPAMPPPVIIPPRGSSANAAMPVAIPMRGSSLAIVPGSESSDDNIESGNSNPSSVIVTPTISMDRTSTSSLLEHPHPNGAFRERSDSGISAGGSQTTDGGLHTPPSEASFPAPLQNRKESDSMHMQPPPALTVV